MYSLRKRNATQQGLSRFPQAQQDGAEGRGADHCWSVMTLEKSSAPSSSSGILFSAPTTAYVVAEFD